MSGYRSIPACTGQPRRAEPHHSETQVYPRVYGATASPFIAPSSRRGLSPRVRGNRHGVNPSLHLRGSIPACTGQPLADLMTRGYARVYPRVYGATGLMNRGGWGIMGLSPRVRGNPYKG